MLALVDTLSTIASAHGPSVTAGQVAIAWMLTQGEDVIPIPGSKSMKYAEENVRAVDVRLTREEVSRVQEAVDVAQKVVVGSRTNKFGDTIAYPDTPPYEG